MGKFRVVAILLGLFALSVVVRVPNLNRPLSKHHEFCTAVALQVMDVWWEEGISAYKGLPAMNYSGEANKHINNFASGSGKMMDDQGNYYYVSHPPFAYYLPYATFSILGRPPTVLGIQVFHMLVGLLCAIALFLIAKGLFDSTTLGLVAFAVYLFNPATLWFQSNTYMSDMLVQLFFVWGVWAFWKTDQNDRYLPLLAITTFLMIYTSWLGVFFGFVVGVWSLWNKKWLWSTKIFIASVSALGLIAFQYSGINGWEAYWAELQQRGGERSFGGSYLYGWFGIIKNYLTSYLPLLILLGSIIVWKGKEIWSRMDASMGSVLLVSAVPVLLLHVFLTNYSGHDFTTLHLAVFISLLVAIAYQVVSTLSYSKIALVVVLVLCVGQYYYINRPGEHSISGERYALEMENGIMIAENSGPEEVVFLIGEKQTPQEIYYAKRNVQRVENIEQAEGFLRRRNVPLNGQVFRKEKGVIKPLQKIILNSEQSQEL